MRDGPRRPARHGILPDALDDDSSFALLARDDVAMEAVCVEARDPQVVALLDELTSELALGGYSADQTFGYSIEQLDRTDVRLVGVAVAGRLVGVGGLELQGKVGELKRFFVAPAHRGTGVADAMLLALLKFALDHDVEVVRLETGDRQQAAIAFYRRHGFAEISRFGAYVNSERLSAWSVDSSRVANGAGQSLTGHRTTLKKKTPL